MRRIASMGRRLLALAAALSALALAVSCGGGAVEITGLTLLDADGNAWENPSLEMEVGDVRSLSVSVTPENATYKDALLWSSTDDSVATVSASGKVTALKAGTASVAVRSATGGEASASVLVTVRAKAVPAEAVELGDSELAIGIGSSRLIAAALAPAGAAGTIEWSSTDESVATVDGTGLVTAHKAGTATIRAKAGEAEAECRVSAVEPYIKFSSPAKFALSSSAGYKYWTGKVEWSHDGEAWTEWDGRAAVNSTDPADGQSVLLVRGDGFCAGYTATTNSMHWTLTPSGGASDKVSCSGDIRTLIDHSVPSDAVLTDCCFAFLFLDCASLDSAPALPSETLAAYCYQNMFYNCRNLTSAPAELPATTLAPHCYRSMFYNCRNLTSAPALPATTLAAYCYCNMFNSCTSLTSVSKELLPATSLAPYCYQQMFYDCSELTSAPALSATSLAPYCYQQMFYGCIKLTSAPVLSATSLAPYCYQQMFYGCSELTSAPALSATSLAPYCYQQMFSGCNKLDSAPDKLPATSLAPYCYQQMFSGCIRLTSAPALPATSLAQYCYQQMFSGCASLTSAPALPATSLAQYCYQQMFSGCFQLKFYEVDAGVAPADGHNKILDLTNVTGSQSNSFSGMFSGTTGDFTGDPSVGKSYYTSNAVVTANPGGN